MKDKKYDKTKDTISIKQFLFQYLNINSSCIRLRHCDLKQFESPLVVTVSNDYADKNPDLIKEGFLILVLDCKKDKATYINPKCIRTLVQARTIRQRLLELEKTKVYTFEDYKVLFDLANELEEEFAKLARAEHYDSDMQELEIMGKLDVIDRVKENDEKWDSLIRIRKDDNND